MVKTLAATEMWFLTRTLKILRSS